MNTDPLVSVIVPAYNEAYALPRCLDSVLAQTHGRLEIIIVNDGSSDKTGEVADAYAAKDSRIKAIHQKNAGAGAARNAGLSAASGQFVQFIDADDRIPVDMTAILIAAIGDADIAACGFRMLTMEGNCIIHERVADTPTEGVIPVGDYLRIYSGIADRVGMLIAYSQCNKLFRLDIIRRAGISYHTDMDCWEDGLFNLQYLTHCRQVATVKNTYYDYLLGTEPGEVAAGNVHRPRAGLAVLRVGTFFEEAFHELLLPKDMERSLAVFADFLIIAIVNAARRDAKSPRGEIVAQLRTIVESSHVQRWFKGYRSQPGQSHLIPFLIKRRMPTLLFALARMRADKRYGAYYSERANQRRGLAWFS